MLQQTQVVTVIPYYERFIRRFPTVETLAAAPLDGVLHLWSGLGYYARARNLHRAAQMIMERYGGTFPTTLEAVQSLPGIGRSTAGAILALSCGQRHPILDGNVKRVMTRYAGIEGFPGERAVEAALWDLADRLTPAERVGHYTQAIMDLGATVCIRSRPLCLLCPVATDCVARAKGWQDRLPSPRPRRHRPQREVHVAITLRSDGAVLLERRPPSGVWGGLWGFPQFESEEQMVAWVGQDFASPHAVCPPPIPGSQPLTHAPTRWPAYHHAFTHFDLALHPWVLHMSEAPAAVADTGRYRWYDPRQPDEVGLAAPVTALLKKVVDSGQRRVEEA